jgi:Domain of unknown function (DUF4336)
MPQLIQLAPGLWECSQALKLPGLKMDHRMTVVRLSTGGVWIHSPCACRPELAHELRALGSPLLFVAPSRFHDLYWSDWFEAFPDASFFAAPGVRQDHPDWPFQHTLAESANFPWEPDIGGYFIDGMPSLNEFVFVHRVTRTLIVADLLFNIARAGQNFLGALFLKLNGIHDRVGVSRIFRSLIRDRAAFRESIVELLTEEFDRIIVGHGGIVSTDGKAVLRNALHWLPDLRA